MRIAISSQNFRTITGHAGKTRRFLILEADGVNPPEEVERIDLPNGMSLHDYHEEDHPLFSLALDAVITQSAGGGFIQRMSRHGISVHPTTSTDPRTAAHTLASGNALPLDSNQCHH